MNILTLHGVFYIDITPVLQQMNEAETLPMNLSAENGGLRKKIGFCRACPQVLYLEYLLHFKCTLAGCAPEPPPLSPLQTVSVGKGRISVKEVQSCELAAAPPKEDKTVMKSTSFQKGNDIEYITWGVVWKIFSGLVPLDAAHSWLAFLLAVKKRKQHKLFLLASVTLNQNHKHTKSLQWVIKAEFVQCCKRDTVCVVSWEAFIWCNFFFWGKYCHKYRIIFFNWQLTAGKYWFVSNMFL